MRISGLSTGGAREARERLWSPFCTPLADLISLDPKAETSLRPFPFHRNRPFLCFFSNRLYPLLDYSCNPQSHSPSCLLMNLSKDFKMTRSTPQRDSGAAALGVS